MALFGGLGGLGGTGGGWGEFGDFLSAIGTSLLTSPRHNMLQGLPAALDSAQSKGKERRSDAAMVTALIDAGLPGDKAALLAANPTAAALVIGQQNQAKQQAFREKAFQNLGGPLVPPDTGGASIGPQSMAPSSAAPTASLSGGSGMDIMTAAKAAIKNNESSGNYGAIGPEVKGDRAYGAYQVMGSNIPEWTKKHLGKALSVKEFVQNPEAQDKVFEGEFGGYLNKYGNLKDAASMWFSGRPMKQAGNASDGYMTVPQYVAKIEKFLGGRAPTQMAQAPAAAPTMASSGEPAPYQVASSGKIPAPMPSRSIPTIDAAPPSGTNRTKSWANEQAQKALAVMAAAGDDKGLLEVAKQRFELASKYLTPTEQQKNLEAAGIDPRSQIGRDIMSGGAYVARERLGLDREREARNAYEEDRKIRLQERQAEQTPDIVNYRNYQQQELNSGREPKRFEEWYLQSKRSGSGTGTTSLTPILGERGGKAVGVFPTNQGTFVEAELPADFKPAPKYQDRDLGHAILRTNADGTTQLIPKGLAQAASETAQGRLTGEQIAQAPANIARITAARQELVELRDDPRRAGTSGLEAFFQLHKIPATDRFAYAQRFAKSKAGAYTQGLQALQGFGPVTEKEGQAAAKAVEDMELALDDKALLDAMTRYDKALEAGLKRAQELLQGTSTPSPMTPRPGGNMPTREQALEELRRRGRL